MDKLMDPQEGIYPALNKLANTLQRNTNRILASLLVVFLTIIGALAVFIVEYKAGVH